VAACREDGTGVKVTSLKLNGVHAVDAGQLKAVLATADSSFLPWGAKHYFSREDFEADLKRIVAFYNDRGYPDAKVASYDVQLSKDQSSVDVTINIDEGQPIRIVELDFEGFDVLPRRHFEGLRQRLPLRQGSPVDGALAQASREMALDELRDHGYPYASVRMTERPGANSYERIVTVRAMPGTLARFGPVTIEGNSSVSDDVIRRQLLYRPGRRFRLSQIQESQRRLYDLETFQFANIQQNTPEGEQPAVVPTTITVTEGDHRKVNFGVGYGSEEKARGTFQWRHVNFFGGARTAGIETRYSTLSRGVRVNLRQPYVFSPHYALTATGQSWWASEPTYDLTTEGGKLTLERQLARPGPLSQRAAATTLSLSYTHEWQDYSISNEALDDLSFRDELIALGLDATKGEGQGTLSSLAFDMRRSTADNLLDAKHGYVASVHLEQAGKLLQGTWNYWETILEGRYYLNVANRAVVAVRARAGSIDGWGNQDENVPFFKRYFLGGATSLRGWGRFDVAPLSGFGLPIGGATMLESSVELRAPVWGKLSGVLFVDAGNVWTNPWDFNMNDLRYDVGPGLRYNTPIGPIRVDLGYQLNPIPGLLVNGKPEPRRFRVHFSIGQAF
jgi:outer membrane protein insertion porin family/translocation and assembly module TamA